MNSEEFETEKRPRPASIAIVSGRLLPSLRTVGAVSGDNSGDGNSGDSLTTLVRVLELWPKLAAKYQDLIADTVEAFASVSQSARTGRES